MSKRKFFLWILGTALVSVFATLSLLFLVIGSQVRNINDLGRFLAAYYFIESRYVEDVDSTKLVDHAIAGMVQSLEDPHSIYLNQPMYRNLKDHTDGTFGGIGVYMGFKDHKVNILAVMDNTPGANAGLQAGDEILSVDGTPTSEIQPEEVAMRIRGEVGTVVVLTVRRMNTEELTVSIVRDTIETKSVAAHMIDEELGYLAISSFSENTGKEFGEKYEELVRTGMKGLILDLRGNPGGLLTSCVEVGQYILPKGVIVSVVERDGKRSEYTVDRDQKLLPLVVLIDKNSASASEIIAGAVQDSGAGTLVGMTSYGKGSVQTVLPMNHEDALKITIAKYYTPNGRSIDGIGIEPDIKIDLPQGDPISMEHNDLQLQKAEVILREKVHRLE